jgi:hypothetical protein
MLEKLYRLQGNICSREFTCIKGVMKIDVYIVSKMGLFNKIIS